MRLNVIRLFAAAGLMSLFLNPVGKAQTVPSAIQTGGLPITAGLGVSDYDVDWGHGRMLGGTIWIDYMPSRVPSILHGLGLEAEARDISLNHSSTQPANFRLDTAGGGPIYFAHVARFPNFHPYGKLILSYGGIDWDNPNPQFTHETRTVMAPGLGFDYRLYRSILLRADYEYQFWPDIAPSSPGTHVLNPQGFTVGAMYDFRHFRRH